MNNQKQQKLIAEARKINKLQNKNRDKIIDENLENEIIHHQNEIKLIQKSIRLSFELIDEHNQKIKKLKEILQELKEQI